MGSHDRLCGGAIIQILQYLSSAEQLKMFTLWSLGSLSHITTGQLTIMLPVICIDYYYPSPASNHWICCCLVKITHAPWEWISSAQERLFLYLQHWQERSQPLRSGDSSGWLSQHITRILFDNANHRYWCQVQCWTGVDRDADLRHHSQSFCCLNCITALLCSGYFMGNR